MAHNKELLRTLSDCAAACEWCANACLDEEDIRRMTRCIRLDLDCAKVCHTTASLVASHSENAQSMIRVCEELCSACAEECAKHEMDHCQECADACRRCADACHNFAGVGV